MSDELVKQLEIRQAEIATMAEEIGGLADPDAMMAKAAEMRKKGIELEALAKEYERIIAEGATDAELASVTFMLTPDQQARILEETGISMVEVEIEDLTRAELDLIPSWQPITVELKALRIATARAKELKARAQLKKEFEKIIADLQAQESPQIQQVIDELMESDDFKDIMGDP